jgi:4-amino-4-deoxy-L-arabinose transferase-like glycosyltransferase
VFDVQTEELTGARRTAAAEGIAVGDALRSSRRAIRSDVLRVAALVLALTAFLRLPAFFVDVFNSDETFLATQAQVIREGGDLYREAADRKPPLVPYVYAVTQALTGTTDLWSVRVAAMLASAATAVLLAVEARRRYGRRAMWLAGVLTTVALVSFAPQDGQAANFEIFMLPLAVLGVMLARRGRGGSAGVAVGLATLAKQTGAATLLPVCFTMLKRRDTRGLGAVGIGFAAPLLVAAALLGPKQLFYWTVLGNGSYVGLKTASALVVTMFVLMTLGWVACNVPILWTLPRSWRARRATTADGEHDTDLWLWALSGAVSVAVGLRFFGHYYLQLVPPLALLAAGALARSSRRAVRGTLALALACGVLFSAAGYFLTPFGEEPEYESVSRFVAARTDDHDRVLVWGNVPEIYWASGVRPATRYIATQSLVAENHAGRGEVPEPDELDPQVWTWFFRDLRRHPPKFIVDTSDTHIRGADRSPMSHYPRLARYVNEHYRFVRTINGLDVYVRT